MDGENLGKKFKAVLILMVLFTFAALLSEPPVEKAVPVESTPVQAIEKQMASPAEQDKEPVVTEPEPAPPTKTIVDADPLEAKKPEASSDVKSISEPDIMIPDSAPNYQDDEWRANVRAWMTPLSDDMATLGKYTTNFDLEGMDSRARMLKTESGFALKDSKEFTVSSELEESKREYESSLADFMTASDYIISAVEKLKNNDIEAGTEDLQTANVYINSGSEHMTAAAEAAA